MEISVLSDMKLMKVGTAVSIDTQLAIFVHCAVQN